MRNSIRIVFFLLIVCCLTACYSNKRHASGQMPAMDYTDTQIDSHKYLNIELYSPNCVDGYISIDSWGEEKMVAQFIGPVPAEPILFQALMNDNTLSFICIASGLFDGDIRVEGVDCYIKKVWATNTKAEFNGNDYAN